MNELIGNTPLIAIKYRYLNKIKTIYAKLEYYNLTGSIKDRLVYYVCANDKRTDKLKESQPIIEATSGNTGISLASFGAYYNHPVHIFMPDWSSQERIAIMELYGAKVHLVSREDGGFKECIRRAKTLCKELDGYMIDQFANNDNIVAHYETTAEEIIKQLPSVGGFISGIGTGGTFMGIAKKLKYYNSKIKTYVLEPKSLPILSGGELKGAHKISGIGDDFIPSIVDKKLIDKILQVDDLNAIRTAQKMAKELGIAVGISSGANLYAAILMNQEVDNVVTIIADDCKKYLSTDLLKKIADDELIANEIEFISYKVIPVN